MPVNNEKASRCIHRYQFLETSDGGWDAPTQIRTAQMSA